MMDWYGRCSAIEKQDQVRTFGHRAVRSGLWGEQSVKNYSENNKKRNAPCARMIWAAQPATLKRSWAVVDPMESVATKS